MTREEAIKILKQRQCCRECVADCTCNECDNAFDMAIKSLEQTIDKEKMIEELEESLQKANATNTKLILLVEGKQKPCEDAVSRKAVAEIINRQRFGIDKISMGIIKEKIEKLPSVTPTKCIATVKFSKEDMQELVNEKMKDIVVERKKGKWILLDECANSGYYCSKCHKKVVKEGWSNTVKKIKYCPNCGAEMESKDGI